MKNIDKRRIASTILCLTLGATSVTGCTNGFHLNKIQQLHTEEIPLAAGPDNTVSGVIYSNEALLNEFENIYNSNEDMKNYWECIHDELSDFILTNGQYLDQEQLLSTLSELKFEEVDRIIYSDNILAAYNYGTNTISFTSRFFVKSPQQQKEITLHEACHYLFFQQFNRASALNEGTASLITREYGTYVGVDAYEKNAYYVKIICELIGSDNYLRAMGHHNYNELVGYLSQYASESQVNDLIDYINYACCDTSRNTESDQDAMELLEMMYLSKNGVTVGESDDNVMKCYFNKLFETEYNIEGARFAYHATVNKNYLVNRDMAPYITFSKYNQLYGTVYLGENNEIISGEVLEEGFYNENGEVIDNDVNILEEKIISYTK